MHNFTELENHLEFTREEQTAGTTLTEQTCSNTLFVQF